VTIKWILAHPFAVVGVDRLPRSRKLCATRQCIGTRYAYTALSRTALFPEKSLITWLDVAAIALCSCCVRNMSLEYLLGIREEACMRRDQRLVERRGTWEARSRVLPKIL